MEVDRYLEERKKNKCKKVTKDSNTMDLAALDINVLPHQPRLKIEAAKIYLDRMPCVISGDQHMAVWSDIREVMFPLCTDSSCFIVLSALKHVLNYPRSETAMHPCSQVEQIEFLRQFRIILPGTILVDIGHLSNLAVLMKLFDIVRVEHLTALRKSSSDCQYLKTSGSNSFLNDTENEKSSFEKVLPGTSGSRVELSILKLWKCQAKNNEKTASSVVDLPSVYRRYTKGTKYLGEEMGVSSIKDSYETGIASDVDKSHDPCLPRSNRKGKAGYPEIDSQDPWSAENFIPMTILLENFPDARDFLIDVARKFLTGGCKRMCQTVAQCSREEAKAFTSHLFSTRTNNIDLKYLTSRSLLLSWQDFSSGFLAFQCSDHEDTHDITAVKRHKSFQNSNITKAREMTVFSPLKDKEHGKRNSVSNKQTCNCQPYDNVNGHSKTNELNTSDHHTNVSQPTNELLNSKQVPVYSLYADGMKPLDGASIEALQSSSCETLKILVDEVEDLTREAPIEKTTDQKEMNHEEKVEKNNRKRRYTSKNHRNKAQASPENKNQANSDMTNKIETQDATAIKSYRYLKSVGWKVKTQNDFENLPHSDEDSGNASAKCESDAKILVIEGVKGDIEDRYVVICKADDRSTSADLLMKNQSPLKDVICATQNLNNSAIFRYSHTGSSSSSDSDRLDELSKASKLSYLGLSQAGLQNCSMSESSVEIWSDTNIDNNSGNSRYPFDYGQRLTECIPGVPDMNRRPSDTDSETHHTATSFSQLLTLTGSDSRITSIAVPEEDQPMELNNRENHQISNDSNGITTQQGALPLCNSNVNQNKNDRSVDKLAAGAKVPPPIKPQSSSIPIHENTTKSIGEKVKELSDKMTFPKMPTKSSDSDVEPFKIARKSRTLKGSSALSKSNLKWDMALITGKDKPTAGIKEGFSISRVQKTHLDSPRVSVMHTAEAVDLSTFVENGMEMDLKSLNEDIRAAELLLSVSGRFSVTGSSCQSMDHTYVTRSQRPTPRQDLEMSGTLSKLNQCSSTQLESTSQSLDKIECGVQSNTKTKSKGVNKEIKCQHSEVHRQLQSKVPTNVTEDNVNFFPYCSGHSVILQGMTTHYPVKPKSFATWINSQDLKDKSVITTRTPNNTPIFEESVQLEKSGNIFRSSLYSNHEGMKVGNNISQTLCNTNTFARAPMSVAKTQLLQAPALPFISKENYEKHKPLKTSKYKPNTVQENMSDLNPPAASIIDTEILNFGASSSCMPDIYDSFARKGKPKCVLVEPIPDTDRSSKGNDSDIKDVQDNLQNTNHFLPVSQRRLIYQKKIENRNPQVKFDTSNLTNTQLASSSVAVQTDPEKYRMPKCNVVKEPFSQKLPLPTLPLHCTSQTKYRKGRQGNHSSLDTASMTPVKTQVKICPACSLGTAPELVSTVSKRTTRKKLTTSKRRSDAFHLPACNAGMVSKIENVKSGDSNAQTLYRVRRKSWSFLDSETKFFPIINDLCMAKTPRRGKRHIEGDLRLQKLAMIKHGPKEGRVGKNKNMSAKEAPTLENVFNLLKNVVFTQSETDLPRLTGEEIPGNVVRRNKSDTQLEMQLPLSDVIREFVQMRDDLEAATTDINSKLDKHFTTCESSEHQKLENMEVVLDQNQWLTNQQAPLLIIEERRPEDKKLVATWQDGRKKQRSSAKSAFYLTPHPDGNAMRKGRGQSSKRDKSGNATSDQEILEIIAAVSGRTPVRNNYLSEGSPDMSLQEPSNMYKAGYGRRVKSAYSSASKQSKSERTDRLKSAHGRLSTVDMGVIGVTIKPETDHKRIGSCRIAVPRSQCKSASSRVAQSTSSSAQGLDQRAKSASSRVCQSTSSSAQGLERRAKSASARVSQSTSSSAQGLERRAKSASARVSQSTSSSAQGLELLAKSAVMRESLKFKDPDKLGCNFFKGILNDELWRPHTSLVAYKKKKDIFTTSSPFRKPQCRGKSNMPGRNRLVNNFMYEESSHKCYYSTCHTENESQQILKSDSATQTESCLSPTCGENSFEDLQDTDNVSNNFIAEVPFLATDEMSDQDILQEVSSSSMEEPFSGIYNSFPIKNRPVKNSKHNQEYEDKEDIGMTYVYDKSSVQQCCSSLKASSEGCDQSTQDITGVWSIPELTPETASKVTSQPGSESSLIMPRLIPEQDIEGMRQIYDENIKHDDWNFSSQACKTLSVDNTSPGGSAKNDKRTGMKEQSSGFNDPEDIPSYRLNVFPPLIMLSGMKRTTAVEKAMMSDEVVLISDPEQIGFGHYCIPRGDGTFLLLPCIVSDQVMQPRPRDRIEVASIATDDEIDVKDGQVEQGPNLKRRPVIVVEESITGDISQGSDYVNYVEEGDRMPIALHKNYISDEELCQYKGQEVTSNDIEENNIINEEPYGKYENQFDLELDMTNNVSKLNEDHKSNLSSGKGGGTVHRMEDQGDETVQEKFVSHTEHDTVNEKDEIRYTHSNLQEQMKATEVIFYSDDVISEVICTTGMETDEEITSYDDADVHRYEDGIQCENISFEERSLTARTGNEIYDVSGIDVVACSLVMTKHQAGVEPEIPNITEEGAGFSPSKECKTNVTENGTSTDHASDNLDYSKVFPVPEGRNKMKSQSSHICSKNVVSDIKMKEIYLNDKRGSTGERLDADGIKLCTKFGNEASKRLTFDEDIHFETGADELDVYISNSESHISNSSTRMDTLEKQSVVAKRLGCSKEMREHSVSHLNVQVPIERTKMPVTVLQPREKISQDSEIKESGEPSLDLSPLNDGQNCKVAKKKNKHFSKEYNEQGDVPREKSSVCLVQRKETETGIKLVISKENLKEYKSSQKKHCQRDTRSDCGSKETETGIKLLICSENLKQNKPSKTKHHKRDRKSDGGSSEKTSAQTGSMTSLLESVFENLANNSTGDETRGGDNFYVQSGPSNVDTTHETKHRRKHKQKKKRSKMTSRHIDLESKKKSDEKKLPKLEDQDEEKNRKKLEERRLQASAMKEAYVPVVRLKRTCRRDNKEYHWEKYVEEDLSDIDDRGDCDDPYDEEEEEDDVGRKRGRISSFLGEQQTIYEILKHGSGDVMKNHTQHMRTRNMKEFDPKEEELLTQVMTAGNRGNSSQEVPGPDAADTGDTSELEDQYGPEGDSTEPVFQNICDEDNVILGGQAYYKAFVLPFVYINGFKYISVQDAIALFQKCARQCTIPRSLLHKDKNIAKSFTCWEQVYQLELIKLKKGPNVQTGDILLRLDHLLARLPALYKEIAAQHVTTKLKKSQACKYNLVKQGKSSHKLVLAPAKSKNTLKDKTNKK